LQQQFIAATINCIERRGCIVDNLFLVILPFTLRRQIKLSMFISNESLPKSITFWNRSILIAVNGTALNAELEYQIVRIILVGQVLIAVITFQ